MPDGLTEKLPQFSQEFCCKLIGFSTVIWKKTAEKGKNLMKIPIFYLLLTTDKLDSKFPTGSKPTQL